MANSLSPNIRKVLTLSFILYSLLFGIYFTHNHIAITLTPSLTNTLFYLSDAAGKEIRKGNYVVFSLSDPITHRLRFSKVTKKVACVAGDLLRVDGRDFYCNDEHLCQAKETSLTGEKLSHFQFNGVIPAGSLFVVGEYKDSYDSRYFGFIKEGSVEKIAYPLFEYIAVSLFILAVAGLIVLHG